ncbi:class I SAM-dependent methyltransferase [Silanimonas sp.]|jgi:SAM-dependent methyltransferase|uniref:class I SAM-dependent methyltransferase n=1 Tax=Silanimonas sp. TaxID=1929290 RepID=UPI0022C03E7E|nr:class I SAM-dependent methyltransferase [Silanimonas sp.]MCZ8062314.1 class I SAM-dependent methyltransferase [Silanimonas sp.]
MSDAPPPLAFTGERYHPEVPREMAYEHWHRYAFAMELARGRHVLDAASGEGYGAALLARTATSVVGVDLSPEAVAHAQSRYGGPRLRFEQGDVLRLEGIADASLDLVVSFETLEHVDEHDALLAAFKRVLKPEGLLVISTPDKHTYTDLAGQQNPHHVRELYREEFEALLSRHFARHRLYGQRVVTHSMLWRLDGGTGAITTYTQDGDDVFGGMRALPMYHVAVCAKRGEALAGLPALSCFADAQQSVFAHYQQVIRELMLTDRYAHTLRERLRAAGLPDGP